MERLDGRVAVITGGAGGIGLAMAERFGAEGMKVVLADVRPEPLEQAASDLRARGIDVTSAVTDVTEAASVEQLRDTALEAYGAVHVVCNNAGIGAGAEGPLWSHEPNDWAWALAVNLWGVIHGINTFVPLLLEQGDQGHVVNTSSGNGGVAPMPGSPQYAVTKAAVVTLTECLYGQLQQAAEGRVGASVLFPGPHMLRTGLFESWRIRPERFAKQRPRERPYVTADELADHLEAAGITPVFTDPADVAADVVAGVRAGDFWIHPASERSDERLRARSASMLARSNPDYLHDLPG